MQSHLFCHINILRQLYFQFFHPIDVPEAHFTLGKARRFFFFFFGHFVLEIIPGGSLIVS